MIHRSMYAVIMALLIPGMHQATEKKNDHSSKNPFNTYQDTVITPQTLPTFKELQASKEVATTAHTWLETHKNLIQAIPHQCTPEKLKEWDGLFKTHSTLHGLHNLGHTNLIFKLPSSDEGKKQEHVIHISGPAKKAACHAAQFGKPYGTLPTMQDYSKNASTDLTTRLTISRAATYLRLLQFKQERNPRHLALAPCYLIPMPWASSSDPISDTTHVVVQEFVPQLEPVKSLPLGAPAELLAVTEYAPIWDCSQSNLKTNGNSVVLLNYEQSTDTPASDFYNATPWRCYDAALRGLAGLHKSGVTVESCRREKLQKLKESAINKEEASA